MAALAAAIVLQRLGTIVIMEACELSSRQRVATTACGAWHRRVMADDVVGHAFSHGFHPQHVERFAAYGAEALGGPTTYSDSYDDETSVAKIHSSNGEHDEMDRRAIARFDQALADVEPGSPWENGYCESFNSKRSCPPFRPHSAMI